MTAQSLRQQFTPFIGRQDELIEIANLLADPACRLLTLMGPGGIGKTRLAAEVVHQLRGKFPDDVYLVPLAPLKSPENIASAIIQSLSLSFIEGQSPDNQLLNYLREKQLLLALDNFEHLLDGVGLVADILEQSSGIKILTTSREPLNLRAEWIRQLDGLRFPKSDPIQNIFDYSAIELFAERAQQVSGDFSLENEMDAVIDICRLVDGMPLAIELAASWRRALPCAEILHEIQQGLGILASNLRDIPERHRSMEAVFDHSWRLLSDDERQTFAKLSVFQGTFTRRAAQHITGASLTLLTALVDKSLLYLTANERYQMHELLRQYAAQKLTETQQTTTTRDAYSDYYLNALAEREADIKGRRQLESLNEIETDFENVRAAWNWAIRQSNFDAIDSALESVFWYCAFRSRFQEGAALFGQSLENLSSQNFAGKDRLFSKIQARRFCLRAFGYMEPENANAELERSLQNAQQSGVAADIAFTLMTLGEVARSIADFATAHDYYSQSLEQYQAINDLFYMARLFQRVGFTRLALGQIKGGEEPLRQGLDLAQEIGAKTFMADCLYNLGSVAGFSLKFDEYMAFYSEALTLRQEIGDRAGVALNLSGLAIGNFLQGNFAETAKLASEALEISSDLNHAESKSQSLVWLGYLACMEEDYGLSRQLLEDGLQLATDWYKAGWAEIGLALVACGQADYSMARRHLQNALGSGSWGSWYGGVLLALMALILIQEGKAARGVEIASFVENHLADSANFVKKWKTFTQAKVSLKADLGETVYARAYEQGKSLDMNAIITQLVEDFPIRLDNPLLTFDSISPTPQSVNQTLIEPLTDREYEILVLITQGLSNRDIADRLFVEVSTVKRHINNCYGKLGVSSRAQAILKAQSLKLV